MIGAVLPLDKTAVSSAGAHGLMQLTEETYEWVSGKLKLDMLHREAIRQTSERDGSCEKESSVYAHLRSRQSSDMERG